jgi:hypothetical protein
VEPRRAKKNDTVMVPIGDIRTLAQRALSKDHPFWKILNGLPNSIPREEFRYRVEDWLILLKEGKS